MWSGVWAGDGAMINTVGERGVGGGNEENRIQLHQHSPFPFC
jgi:hypothetical protein